ncbi:kinase-like domain, phloem protein 2-like protein [Tanacetum coccineum]
MEESLCMQSYVEALKDEEKLLYQKAKIKWLSFVEAMKDEEKLLSTSKALRISERDKTPSLLMSREVNWESMLSLKFCSSFTKERTVDPSIMMTPMRTGATIDKQTDTFMMSSVNPDDFAHLKIPLKNILSATNNFAKENFMGEAAFGNHYQGQLMWSRRLIKIHAQRFTKEWDEKEQQFWMEIFMLSTLKHKNLVSLVGFCDENDERIIIIKLETKASLDNYLSDTLKLTWVRRLEIGVAIAHALSYIHYDESRDFSVIHGNINSDTILLNDSWEPKLCEFRLSMKIEASERYHSFRVDKVRDMEGYTDPTYIETNMANHKSDIYSFGIVMFELLCGRKSVIANDTNKYLAPMAISHYTEKKLHEIIDWGLWKQIDSESFNFFAETAYDCLNEERSQRPNIDDIVPKLEKALKLAYENRPISHPHCEVLKAQQNQNPEAGQTTMGRAWASFIHQTQSTTAEGSSSQKSRDPLSRMVHGLTQHKQKKARGDPIMPSEYENMIINRHFVGADFSQGLWYLMMYWGFGKQRKISFLFYPAWPGYIKCPSFLQVASESAFFNKLVRICQSNEQD